MTGNSFSLKRWLFDRFSNFFLQLEIGIPYYLQKKSLQLLPYCHLEIWIPHCGSAYLTLGIIFSLMESRTGISTRKNEQMELTSWSLLGFVCGEGFERRACVSIHCQVEDRVWSNLPVLQKSNMVMPFFFIIIFLSWFFRKIKNESLTQERQIPRKWKLMWWCIFCLCGTAQTNLLEFLRI